MFWFCILYRVNTSVLLSFSLSYLIVCLFFDIKYVFVCLIYFCDDFILCLIVFFVRKLLTFTFLLFPRLLSVSLPRFEWFLVNVFSFLLFSQIVYCIYPVVWFLFCLVTVFLADAFIHTHPHPSVPICTHPWHFSSNRPKHDVRGEFPDHRVQILTCETINAPHLPCSCIPCDPWSLMHPSAPIHTHCYLFVPVCSLYFHL